MKLLGVVWCYWEPFVALCGLYIVAHIWDPKAGRRGDTAGDRAEISYYVKDLGRAIVAHCGAMVSAKSKLRAQFKSIPTAEY